MKLYISPMTNGFSPQCENGHKLLSLFGLQSFSSRHIAGLMEIGFSFKYRSPVSASGLLLRKYRESRGLTVLDMSKKLDITEIKYKRLESGSSICHADILVKLGIGGGSAKIEEVDEATFLAEEARLMAEEDED